MQDFIIKNKKKKNEKKKSAQMKYGLTEVTEDTNEYGLSK